MKTQPYYGMTAKVFHWLIVALLLVQYPLGWLMPDIKRGMTPGVGMTLHVSIGTVILALILARFVWRLTHPVAPEGSLQPWQRLASEGLHWLLYLAVLATTVSGWLFASARGWAISWFFLAPMPMLTAGSAARVRALDGWHQDFEFALLILIGLHVASAILHLFYYRDRVMQRMLPDSLR